MYRHIARDKSMKLYSITVQMCVKQQDAAGTAWFDQPINPSQHACMTKTSSNANFIQYSTKNNVSKYISD